ncbi:hypothetical protein T4A_11278 [Trichinella pseudospiralis]|uniref:Uncharacterized protein n=1 Tax=Trichinella pseudospiralis TaxID=6337 RepID=A0A0V1EM07_TRIPS|nr:hypothetical protein T4A_11278 [Trichinella pseudospiralis]
MTAELSARFRTIEVIHLKEDCVVERSRLPTIRLIPAHQHVFLLSYRYRNSDVINTFVRVYLKFFHAIFQVVFFATDDRKLLRKNDEITTRKIELIVQLLLRLMIVFLVSEMPSFQSPEKATPKNKIFAKLK